MSQEISYGSFRDLIPFDDDTEISPDQSLQISDGVIKLYESAMLTAGSDKKPENREAAFFGDTVFKELNASILERDHFNRSIIERHGSEKYQFSRFITAGGMGMILQVKDQRLCRTTAMKVILPEYKSDRDALSNFTTEAKVTGYLEHPNIIPVHELDYMEDTGLFFTMKLAEGESLLRIIKKLKQEDTDYTSVYTFYHLLNIFRKICDAMSFAHSRYILHQDIKPENVMVGAYGEVLLMDWGMAKFIGDPKMEKDPVRREMLEDIAAAMEAKENMIEGSPAYMSPEQAQGDPKLLSRQSDVFLLGATLYHMFTLELPYEGEDIYQVLDKAEKRTLVPPRERCPGRQIPEALSRIIMKAMAKEPENRYPNVDALTVDIDNLISGKWTREKRRRFKTGEFLMKDGDIGDEAYLIQKGRVEVFKDIEGQKVVYSTLLPGEIVGEMALITEEKRSANVMAMEDTTVAVLTRHIMEQNLKKLPPFMEHIISSLTDRLRIANERVSIFSTMDCTYAVLQQFRLIFKDKAGDNVNAGIQERKMIEKITENLGVPKDRAREVINRAVRLKLILRKGDYLQIPDMTVLKQFIQFSKTLAHLTEQKRDLLMAAWVKKKRTGSNGA